MNFAYVKLFFLLALISYTQCFFIKRSECETTIQNPNKYGCTDSPKICRACCSFDLSVKNEVYGEKMFHLKESKLIPDTNFCTCEICRNKLEDFNNKPYF